MVAAFAGREPTGITIGGRLLRMERAGRGWQVAFVDTHAGQTRAWYERSALARGGRIVVAPDREYRLRAGLVSGWSVREDRTTIAELRERGSERAFPLQIATRRPPSRPDDTPLLLAVACAMVVLEYSIPDMRGP